MNRQRVKEIIAKHSGDADIDKFIWEEYDKLDDNVEHMDGYRGYEGGENITWAVYKITDDVTQEVAYVKFTGEYNSWNGTDWNEDFYFVEPKEVVVIQYHKLKG